MVCNKYSLCRNWIKFSTLLCSLPQILQKWAHPSVSSDLFPFCIYFQLSQVCRIFLLFSRNCNCFGIRDQQIVTCQNQNRDHGFMSNAAQSLINARGYSDQQYYPELPNPRCQWLHLCQYDEFQCFQLISLRI